MVKILAPQRDNTIFGKYFCKFYLQSRERIKDFSQGKSTSPLILAKPQWCFWAPSFTHLNIHPPSPPPTLTHTYTHTHTPLVRSTVYHDWFNPTWAELWTFCMSGIISEMIVLWVHKHILNSLVQIESSSTDLSVVQPCSPGVSSPSLNLLVAKSGTPLDFCVCVVTQAISPRKPLMGCTTGKE